MPNSSFKINGKEVGNSCQTYFIADLAANHDGSLQRAKDLIFLAAEAGADAAKFQHFSAKTIVSDVGFRGLPNLNTHQSAWTKSVYQVYDDASLNLEWTSELKRTCDEAKIAFFTSPYSFELVDFVDQYVPAYKIGSGDITWTEIIRYIAGKDKPYFIATGASTMEDVERAVNAGIKINPNICLMQCNTNYTGSVDNFKHIQLAVLNRYRERYPNLILGLSDHTPGHATVLGAVALGARAIEKHFTDNKLRIGPDHSFSMDKYDWRQMVDRSRELELALGANLKKIEENEYETSIIQRRSIRAGKFLKAGSTISRKDLEVLRPCPADGIQPFNIDELIGKKLLVDIQEGMHIQWSNILR